MPNTPKVDFKFVNNNVQASIPLLGVSSVVACTTKGPVEDPSTVINSLAKFREIFGEEVVPDGSVSNIERALEKGSKLRICRILPGGSTAPTIKGGIQFKLYKTNNESVTYDFTMESTVKGQIGNGKGWKASIVAKGGINQSLYLNQYDLEDNVLDARLMVIYSAATAENAKFYVDVDTLQNFFTGVPNISFVPKSDEAKTWKSMIAFLRNNTTRMEVTVVSDASSHNAFPDDSLIQVGVPVDLKAEDGVIGSKAPAVEDWSRAVNILMDYNESYQLILSHVTQWYMPEEDGQGGYSTNINGSLSQIYSAVKNIIIPAFEMVWYVEVPKIYKDKDTIKEVLQKIQKIAGEDKSVAYFGGGIKLYDNNGILQDCDVLGTVVGLGDKVASDQGVYYSFAGMNRGIVPEASGPVTENYGVPSKFESLQELADYALNLFVIKDTAYYGKSTMLWHNFTSIPKNSSDKFLSITRLNLFLKKNLRPILENYIEEPNTFSTWESIYYKAKRVLDPLVGVAMTSYNYQGDQFAKSYNELTVNNEADVRMGKYKILLSYKDIVTLQEVEVTISIDAASNSVEVVTE